MVVARCGTDQPARARGEAHLYTSPVDIYERNATSTQHKNRLQLGEVILNKHSPQPRR